MNGAVAHCRQTAAVSNSHLPNCALYRPDDIGPAFLWSEGDDVVLDGRGDGAGFAPGLHGDVVAGPELRMRQRPVGY